jgi:tetratricopeptide (TPR) repeat protein/transcriptional regulator with XRE-family HTH domain
VDAEYAGPGAGFGEMLRRYRLAAGLSQEELAERSGLTARAIANIERGRTVRPYPRSVRALTEALALPEPDRAVLQRASRPTAPAASSALSQTAGAETPEWGESVLRQPPAPASEFMRFSLPADTAAFTGRATEIERIVDGATMSAPNAATHGVVRLCAVRGMPGVGKTALAVHAAHLLAGQFGDRQLYVDLHGHTTGRSPVPAADVLAGLLAAVGVEARQMPADTDGRSALWRDRLAGQRLLLVLDNAADSDQVVPLLPGTGDCLVLVTSRRHLADLPGLTEWILLAPLSPGEAAEMFARLAPLAAWESAAAVDELAEVAGGLPLAVSLLARTRARHPAWELRDLIGEAQARMLSLTAEHATVEAAFEVSWQSLDEENGAFLALLGLHPATSFDALAAAALTGKTWADALRILDQLEAEGLLAETGYRRYSLHDLIRQYLAARVTEAVPIPERQSALGRLLDYYQQAADLADSLLPRPHRWNTRRGTRAIGAAVPDLTSGDQALTWLRVERAALLACRDHLAATGQRARLVALTAGLAGLLRQDGPWDQARALHAQAAQAAEELGDRAGQAGALLSLGDVERLMGDTATARTLAKVIGMFRDLDDQLGQAAALSALGEVQRVTGDNQAAAVSLEKALDIYRDQGDELGTAYATYYLATVRSLTDRLPDAAELLDSAIRLFSQIDDQAGKTNSLNLLALVQKELGDYPAAARNLTESLNLSRKLGNRLGQANALSFRGLVRQTTGDYAGAAEDLASAVELHREVGSRHGEASALCIQGSLACRTGDYYGAQAILTGALALAEQIGSSIDQANALAWLAEAAWNLDGHAEAEASLQRSLALFREIGDRTGQAEVFNKSGTLHLVQGRIGAARDDYQLALGVAREIGMPLEEGRALAGLGRCERACGNTDSALTLLRQALQITHRTGAADAAAIAAELADIAAHVGDLEIAAGYERAALTTHSGTSIEAGPGSGVWGSTEPPTFRD